MKEINIAELLKDCPKGMELYSTIFGTVYFEGVRDTGRAVLIDITTVCNTVTQFYPDGRFNTYYSDSEMTLFPSKDVRTWEGIEAPFKDGVIVSTDDGMFTAIVGKVAVCKVKDLYNHDEEYDTYCHIYYEEDDDKAYFIADDAPLRFDRLANEEEKERLFQAIKENSYQWNAENKTLEKLIKPKFKIGDKIVNDDYVVEITEIDSEEEVYIYESKVGGVGCILFSEQDNWELVPNKFDINTLKPFDKVLVMYDITSVWTAVLYSHYDKEMPESPFCCMGAWFERCIPYEGNEHLLGTDEDCDDYYKYWK